VPCENLNKLLFVYRDEGMNIPLPGIITSATGM